jgi:hypothetical protein
MNRVLRTGTLLAIMLLGNSAAAPTARAETEKAHSQIYGFVMLDAGYFTTPPDPKWFDTMRPSKLPSFDDQFGKDGQTFWGVRQSKLAIKSWVPTGMGELFTQFEFDLYGVGVDAGQTTIRPRVFYGELGHWGAGQIASAFMDLDVFPNCLDYWGPNGMLFFRNPQIRFMQSAGQNKLTLALERPGASGDAGVYSDRVNLAGVIPSFPVPDLSGNYRMGQKWGYLQLAGIVRYIKWEDLAATPTSDLSGNTTGWGVALSGNLNKGKTDVVRFQGIYGAGIENYFNDAPIDVGAKPNPGNAVTPFDGEALPIGGVSVALDHTWTNPKYSSSFCYAQNVVDNSAGQAADAFHMGQWAIANLLYSPVPDAMCGVELGWERRVNNADGFDVSSVKIQVSFKYSFSISTGGGQ